MKHKKILAALIIALTLIICMEQPTPLIPLVFSDNNILEAKAAETNDADVFSQAVYLPTDKILEVYVFDVGQADCILIRNGDCSILIDAGNTGQDSLILGYLADRGISSLDFLIATHPHADHIGSMAAVVRAMDSIGILLMPDVIYTTTTFEKLLEAIEEITNNLAVCIKDGVSIDVPLAMISGSVREGDVLILNENETQYVVNRDETQKRRDALTERFARLRKRLE